MELIFVFLTIIGIIFELAGILGFFRALIKKKKHPYAFRCLMIGFVCHGMAFLVSHIA